MVALALANAVGVVLFGALYAVAGAALMSQSAFVPCLVLLFGLVTGVWIRTEAQHRGLDLPRRVGRAAIGLVLVLVGTPALVLTPLFWLESQLPAEAGFHGVLAPVMAVLLIALGLTVLVNAVGGVVAVSRGLIGRRRRARA